MKKEAWVTLATNDDYAIGALVLGQSIKRVGTSRLLHIIITSGVTEQVRKHLLSVFDDVSEVDPLNSKDHANLRLIKRPDLAVTFTKFHCWRLVQYSKCVFVDADCMMLKQCDDLFSYDEFSAAPDVGWPDIFNTGVFVMTPNYQTFDKLVDFASRSGSFDGGDQGILNEFFDTWKSRQEIRLPFTYNTSSSASYTYISAFKRFANDIKIVHFLGRVKPWNYKFNILSGNLLNQQDGDFNTEHVRLWWHVFVESVMPFLFKIPEQLHVVKYDERRAQTPQEPISYYYNPPVPQQQQFYVPSRVYDHGTPRFDGPPRVTISQDHWVQPGAGSGDQPYPRHDEQHRAYVGPYFQGQPQPDQHHYWTPAPAAADAHPLPHHHQPWQSAPTAYHYQPEVAVQYQDHWVPSHQPEQHQHYYPPHQPPPHKPPVVAAITFNIEPAHFIFGDQQQHHELGQAHPRLPPQSFWAPPSSPPPANHYHHWQQRAAFVAPQASSYVEQPWQPPELPSFAASELAAAERPYTTAPRVWPPALADVARCLTVSEDLEPLKVLAEIARIVPNDILSAPLDTDVKYPSRRYENRLTDCPICEESFSYLDDYFPVKQKESVEVDEEKPQEASAASSSSEDEESAFDYEDYEHRLSWEQGVIDYRGRDSWDNIMQFLLQKIE